MANFEIPFSVTGPRRTPTADEKANGFPCGPADQTLFNGMFHRIEAEIGNVIAYAGLVGTDADYSQLRKAIVALIEAATGGGEEANYVLLSQVTARMPIFPEIQSADGKINITSPAGGVVRVPGGINFLHRGLAVFTTVQTDFNTIASRTYHLRWSPTGGLVLKYLLDGAYNPGGLAETDRLFDSTYDDMLIARVVTNSGNVATITPLANKNVLRRRDIMVGTSVEFSGDNAAAFDFQQNINFARTPDYLWDVERVYTDGPIYNDGDMAWTGFAKTETRYEFKGRRVYDMATVLQYTLLSIA